MERTFIKSQLILLLSLVIGVLGGIIYAQNLFFPTVFFGITFFYATLLFLYRIIKLTALRKSFRGLRRISYCLAIAFAGDIGLLASSVLGLITPVGFGIFQSILFGLNAGFFTLAILMTVLIVVTLYKYETHCNEE